MVTDLWILSLIIQEEHGKLCVPCSSRIMSINEMLPEIHAIKMYDFLKRIIKSQTINFFCYKRTERTIIEDYRNGR